MLVPVIELGVAGAVLTVIACVEAELVPQPLLAVTDTFPLVALAVVEIEFVVELPDQPPGKVQLYVTPPTLVTA